MPICTAPSITSQCCEITRSGFYQLDPGGSSDTLVSNGGDCVVVAVSNVTVNLNGATIESSVGSGAGIHVMPKAANVFIEGDQGTVKSFANGVEIDGMNDTVEFLTTKGNSVAGVFLNGARQAKVADVISGDFGPNPSEANIYGIRVAGGSYNQILNADCEGNAFYGIWLAATSYNSVIDFRVVNNAHAGLYVGCSNTGPQGMACPRKATSNYNSIAGGVATDPGSDSQSYGVAIELGSANNRVTGITATGNHVLDVFDENQQQTSGACGSNLWFAETIIGNDFPGCIH